MSGLSFTGRPPAEAVSYFEQKIVGGRFAFSWRDVQREEHLHSFVVAKMAQRDLLEDTFGALSTGLKEGWSRERFIKELTPTLQAKGWWGKQRLVDPVTGVEQVAQLGSSRRLQTIFDTNMRMAHSAGRWERMMRSASTRPFATYHHTDQLHPRLDHQAWDGITLPLTHVFWRTHYCPNGWKCKCFVTSHRTGEVTSEEELERRGVYRTRLELNRRTGRYEVVPFGIDAGFEYNVGQARLQAFVPPARAEPQRPAVVGDRAPAALPPLGRGRSLPGDIALRPELAGADAGTVFEAFSKALGKGEGEVFIDKAQVPLVAGRRVFQQHDAAGLVVADKAGLGGRAEYAEVLAATLKDPDEIWHSAQLRADGSVSLVRNYVARWKGIPTREVFVVTYHEKDGAWWGTTAYGAGRRGEVDQQQRTADTGHRVGTLVYRRK